MDIESYRRREQERRALHKVEDKIKIATLFFTAKQLTFLASRIDIQQTLAQGDELREDQLDSLIPGEKRGLTSIIRLGKMLKNVDPTTPPDTTPPQGIPEDLLYELSDLPDDNINLSLTRVICGSQNQRIRMNLPESAVSGLIYELDDLFDNQEFCANCESWSYWDQPPLSFIIGNAYYFLALHQAMRKDFRKSLDEKFDGVITDIFGNDPQALLRMDPVVDLAEDDQ